MIKRVTETKRRTDRPPVCSPHAHKHPRSHAILAHVFWTSFGRHPNPSSVCVDPTRVHLHPILVQITIGTTCNPMRGRKAPLSIDPLSGSKKSDLLSHVEILASPSSRRCWLPLNGPRESTVPMALEDAPKITRHCSFSSFFRFSFFFFSPAGSSAESHNLTT